MTLYPSIDALQEFRVQSGNYSAEYGGNAGANINLQLRSGTNQFHASIFEFLRNNAFDARGYFRPSPLPQDVLKRNQFGAVVSGPIWRDKTFFMLGYEAIRSKRESAGTSIVLSEAERAGDFSRSATPIIDPLTGSPFAGNMIPVESPESRVAEHYQFVYAAAKYEWRRQLQRSYVRRIEDRSGPGTPRSLLRRKGPGFWALHPLAA